MLVAYGVVGVSAVFVFGSSLDQIRVTVPWQNPIPARPPTWAHPFGILPGFGTGLFTALWKATPWDLVIVGGILSIDVGLGLVLGGIAGFTEGGVLDTAITFVGDALTSIPAFFLVLVAFAGLSTIVASAVGFPAFIVIFGLLLWPTIARTVRERARVVAHEPFVEASRAAGASSTRLVVRHILPNSLGPVLAQAPLDVAPVFFVLSVFPWFYNCIGPTPSPGHNPPPGYLIPYLPPFSPLPSPLFPEWGYLLGFGTCEAFNIPGGFDYWWMYLFPLLAIALLGFAIALVCDGLERRRQFDR
jgi:ABC-type dipeptide/oligopeptide/nickel transport system permease subunit